MAGLCKHALDQSVTGVGDAHRISLKGAVMSRLGRLSGRSASVAAVVAVLSGFGASAAYAGDGLCNAGYMCIYKNEVYDVVKGTAKSSMDLWGDGWNDIASSVSVNGTSCRYSIFYEHTSGSYGYGETFTMYSRTLMGYNYRDPALSNGAGFDGVNEGSWDNRISYAQFSFCS